MAHGGKRPNSGAKKRRPQAVRTISVQLGAAEDALLTRLELQWREPAAAVMRRGLQALAKMEWGG